MTGVPSTGAARSGDRYRFTNSNRARYRFTAGQHLHLQAAPLHEQFPARRHPNRNGKGAGTGALGTFLERHGRESEGRLQVPAPRRWSESGLGWIATSTVAPFRLGLPSPPVHRAPRVRRRGEGGREQVDLMVRSRARSGSGGWSSRAPVRPLRFGAGQTSGRARFRLVLLSPSVLPLRGPSPLASQRVNPERRVVTSPAAS